MASIQTQLDHLADECATTTLVVAYHDERIEYLERELAEQRLVTKSLLKRLEKAIRHRSSKRSN